MPAKKRRATTPQEKLTITKPRQLEEDLLWHVGHGYQLETSSLGDDPILLRLEDNTEVRATAKPHDD